MTTTQATHTPGPWAIEDSGEGDAYLIADGGIIASLCSSRDVNLIAAAPEMLSALKYSIRNIQCMLDVGSEDAYEAVMIDIIATMKKCITKAEGRA